MTFGNLVKLVGFKVISCLPFHHQWCPDFKENYNKPDFHKRCREYAKKNNNIRNIGNTLDIPSIFNIRKHS